MVVKDDRLATHRSTPTANPNPIVTSNFVPTPLPHARTHARTAIGNHHRHDRGPSTTTTTAATWRSPRLLLIVIVDIIDIVVVEQATEAIPRWLPRWHPRWHPWPRSRSRSSAVHRYHSRAHQPRAIPAAALRAKDAHHRDIHGRERWWCDRGGHRWDGKGDIGGGDGPPPRPEPEPPEPPHE